jgi:hypothetical protein
MIAARAEMEQRGFGRPGRMFHVEPSPQNAIVFDDYVDRQLPISPGVGSARMALDRAGVALLVIPASPGNETAF